MEQEKIRIWNISKRVIGVIGILIILVLLCKFAVYFMPFFIAAILALITEPIIKFNMNKLRMSRRMSSLVVDICTIVIILAFAIWVGIFAVGKLIAFSKELPSYVGQISNTIQTNFTNIADDLSEYVSEDVIAIISDSLSGVLSSLSTYVQNMVSSLLRIVMSVPRFIVNIIITILAFILFTKDRVNIINIVDFHFPSSWIKKGLMIKNEVITTLGSYLKVYSKIIVLTTIELLISFSILNLIGFKIEHIIRLSVLIAIVDILPVLGIGTILIPWSILSLVMGEFGFGIALIIVYIVLTIIRQLVEPKLVSNQLGVHPIITLFAMYAGFKLIGFSGLILGPFALVILRCVYAEQIKKGLFKSLVE